MAKLILRHMTVYKGMPICNQCTNEFPNRIFQDGKEYILHRRKYCTSCSPIGTRKFCGPKPSLKPKTKRKNNSKAYRRKKKMKALEYLDGKCRICGYDKCISALSFHHLDPNNKQFNVSYYWEYSWDFLKPELDKCIVLCCNCHAEVHEGITKMGL